MFSALRQTTAQGFSLSQVFPNLLSGLIVGIVALPLSMALAIAVGVAPQHGIYTAIVAGIATSLTGGSRFNITGPTAAFVVVLLPITQQYGLGGLLLSGFMAGFLLVLMGKLGLGRVIEVTPYPVIIGFTAGIAVVIATLQLKDFFGLEFSATSNHYVAYLKAIVTSLPRSNGFETLVGFASLAILILWPRLGTKIPAHIVAIVAGAVFAYILNHSGLHHGVNPDDESLIVSTIGSRFHYTAGALSGHGVPPFLPAFEWPWNLPDQNGHAIGIHFSLLRTLFAAAVTIAVLGALESLLCAAVADGMTGQKHNPNDELIGQGIGNILAPLFGGIPATAAIARTTTNIRSGGTSVLSPVIHSLTILLSILLFAPLLSYIPMATFAALLLMVAWNIAEIKHFIRIVKIAPKDDITTLLACFFLTVIFDMTVAVAVGVGLAAILFIRRSIQLSSSLPTVPQMAGQPEIPAGVLVYDINGPLFFGSAHKAISSLTQVGSEIKVLILDMSEVTMLDMSALVALESIVAQLQAKRIGLVFNGLQPRMILKLRRAGVRKRIGKLIFSRRMEDALATANQMLQQSDRA